MNMIERPSGNYETFEYYNDSGGTLVQYHFVLKVNADDVSFPTLGYFPDHQGVENEAYGVFRSEVGSVWQIAQIDEDVSGLVKDDAIYFTPGHGLFHHTPVDGDYLVAYLTEDQGDNDFITVKLTPPQPVTVEEEQ